MMRCSCTLEMKTSHHNTPKFIFWLKNWPVKMCIVLQYIYNVLSYYGHIKVVINVQDINLLVTYFWSQTSWSQTSAHPSWHIAVLNVQLGETLIRLNISLKKGMADILGFQVWYCMVSEKLKKSTADFTHLQQFFGITVLVDHHMSKSKTC